MLPLSFVDRVHVLYPALTRYSIKICWGVSTSQHRRHLREGITCICFPHTSTMAAGDEFRAWVGQVAYKPASYYTAHVNPQKKDKIIWKHEPRVTLSQDPHPPEAARGLVQSAQRHSLRFGSDTSKAGGFIPISFSPASMCSAGHQTPKTCTRDAPQREAQREQR